jgi:hypothetical protein
MLSQLDWLENAMNDQAKSYSVRAEAAQKAQELAAKIRQHSETHEGCDYRPIEK